MIPTIRRAAAVALLSTTLVAAAVTAAAGPASAQNPATTYLTSAFTHDLDSVTIAKGQSITAYGHLQDAYVRNLPGYVVSLYARSNASKPWTDLRGIVSDANGKVAQRVTPNYSTQLQWRFAGADGHEAVNSPILNLTVGVPPSVLTATDTTAPGSQSVFVAAGQPSTLVGILYDAQFHYPIAGASITLFARGDSAKPWVPLKTLTTDATGRVSQVITPHYDVQLRWSFTGSAVHTSSSSPVISLVIGASPSVLSITDSAVVAKGSSTTVAGHLYTFQGVHDIAGQQLDLYARANAGAPWIKIASRVTDGQGKVAQLVTPNYTVELEWRYAGSAQHRATTSHVITLTVMPPG